MAKILTIIFLIFAGTASAYTVMPRSTIADPNTQNAVADGPLYGISDRLFGQVGSISYRSFYHFDVRKFGLAPSTFGGGLATYSFKFHVGTNALVRLSWQSTRMTFARGPSLTQLSGSIDSRGRYTSGSILNLRFVLSGGTTDQYGAAPYARFNIHAVPLPASILLLLFGFASIFVVARRA